MSENVTLTPRQHKAIRALLLARDVKQAAGVADVSERQLRRWLKDETFSAAVKAAEAEALSSAVRRLTAAADFAVDALLDCLQATRPPGVRVQAATVILGRLRDLRELGDLETRLAALEAQLAEARQPAVSPNGSNSNGKLSTAIASTGNGHG